jgi:predicted transcriptional regulator
MFKDTSELAENKLLLLYIINKLDMPVSNSDITQIVLENNLINYFSLQQYLSELIESGFLNDLKEDRKHTLSINTKGREVLQFFTSRIPEKKKTIIDSYLEVHLPNIKSKLEVLCEYEPLKDDSFIVSLKLMNKNGLLMELKLPAASNTEARKICSCWKENSNDIFKNIMKMFDI